MSVTHQDIHWSQPQSLLPSEAPASPPPPVSSWPSGWMTITCLTRSWLPLETNKYSMRNESHTCNNVGINEVLNCILTLLLLASVGFSRVQNCGTIRKTEMLVQSSAFTLGLNILLQWNGRALNIWETGQTVLVWWSLGALGKPHLQPPCSARHKAEERGGGGEEKMTVPTYLALVKVAGKRRPLDQSW